MLMLWFLLSIPSSFALKIVTKFTVENTAFIVMAVVVAVTVFVVVVVAVVKRLGSSSEAIDKSAGGADDDSVSLELQLTFRWSAVVMRTGV